MSLFERVTESRDYSQDEYFALIEKNCRELAKVVRKGDKRWTPKRVRFWRGGWPSMGWTRLSRPMGMQTGLW